MYFNMKYLKNKVKSIEKDQLGKVLRIKDKEDW